MRKPLIRIVLTIVTVFLCYIAAVLIYGTVNDYQPEAVIALRAEQTADSTMIQDSVLTFTIWNIGYGGLGAEADFFFDDEGMLRSGNSMIYPPRELTEKYTAGIAQSVQTTRSDFFMLQEVDVNSKRSHFINQLGQIKNNLPKYSAFFAPNYNLPSVTIPLFEPWHFYGKVYSGVATFGKYQPVEATRYQLPGSFAWPTRILQLDRCILLQKYKLKNGKQLVLLNVHNSAHDKDGSLKRQERDFIKDLIVKEYEKGNYVIAGGDWNECPPNFPFNTFQPTGDTQGYEPRNVPTDFLPADWVWVYDPTVPTNRSVRDPYQKDVTFTTLLDYFLISPNVQVTAVKALNQQFQYSDHQAVWMEVRVLF
jgi:endonuclease/exonuclease/phosphatase family metal-dependent hydrolase